MYTDLSQTNPKNVKTIDILEKTMIIICLLCIGCFIVFSFFTVFNDRLSSPKHNFVISEEQVKQDLSNTIISLGPKIFQLDINDIVAIEILNISPSRVEAFNTTVYVRVHCRTINMRLALCYKFITEQDRWLLFDIKIGQISIDPKI